MLETKRKFHVILTVSKRYVGDQTTTTKIVLNRTSLVASYPNRYPAPRGLTPQPWMSSGSDHIRSQYAPWWGIYMVGVEK